jgi:hypothetical protein
VFAFGPVCTTTRSSQHQDKDIKVTNHDRQKIAVPFPNSSGIWILQTRLDWYIWKFMPSNPQKKQKKERSLTALEGDGQQCMAAPA